MDRRDVEDRRKIARFTAKSVNENLKILLKISLFQQVFFLVIAIYLMLMLIFIGKSMLALFVLGGGSLVFAAFRLRDLNENTKLYLENESVTNLERTTNAIVLMFLLYTFVFAFGTIALILIKWNVVTQPFSVLF